MVGRSQGWQGFLLGLCLGLYACPDDSTLRPTPPGPPDSGEFRPFDSGIIPDFGPFPDLGFPCACDLVPDSCDPQCGCDPFCDTQDLGVPERDAGVDLGGVDLGPPDLGGSPFDPSARATERATAFCRFLERCSPASLEFFELTFQTCVEQNVQDLLPQFQAYGGGILEGRLTFDEEAFDACQQAYSNSDCVAGITPGLCNDQRAWTGSGVINDACFVNPECGQGLFCKPTPGQLCGTCQRRAFSGSSCDEDLCGVSDACFEILATGEMRCLSDTLAEGELCGTTQTGLCNGQLDCIGTPATCQRPQQTQGAPCGTGPDGPRCNVNANLNCDGNSCEMLSWVGTGSFCGATRACRVSGGRCDFILGICFGLPNEGSACFEGRCRDGLYCDNASVCRALKNTNEACDNPRACAEPNRCLAGVCQPLVYNLCP